MGDVCMSGVFERCVGLMCEVYVFLGCLVSGVWVCVGVSGVCEVYVSRVCVWSVSTVCLGFVTCGCEVYVLLYLRCLWGSWVCHV